MRHSFFFVGMDTAKYHASMPSSITAFEESLCTLRSQLSDSERFQHAEKLSFQCLHCRQSNIIESLLHRHVSFVVCFVHSLFIL